jgi:hypothetical protein
MSFLSAILTALTAVGDFLETHNGAVTAVATIFIAIFTVVLAVVTNRQARLTRIAAVAAEKAAEIARTEFIASHRPRLRVRNVVVKNPKAADGRELQLFAPGQTIEGQFYIANVGDSRADILDGHCTVYFSQQGLPMRRPYEGGEDNLQATSRTLLSGESTPVLFRGDAPPPGAEMGVGTNAFGSWDLYVMGWVTYADHTDPPTKRRTSFCRQYRLTGIPGRSAAPIGRFHKVEEPDYEHEE